MAEENRRLIWGKRIVLAVSLLSPFFFVSLGRTPWGNEMFPGAVLQELAYPLERSWQSFSQGVRTTWEHYIDLTDAARENDALKQESLALKAQLLRFEELKSEVDRLRSLLKFRSRYPDNHTLAEVVSGSPSLPFQSVRISRGSLDDVAVGMPVVTGEGIVGKIIRVGLNHADVQVLTDSNFHADVLMQRSRVRGVLRGFRNKECILELNQRSEVRIGDTVITSGVVGAFPKGIPLGKVVRISYAEDKISQIVTVEPWVDLDRLEEVAIILREDPEVRMISETAGKGWLSGAMKRKGG